MSVCVYVQVSMCLPQHVFVNVCVCLCVQVGICVLWHVCPQHGATVGPVPASWRLNLLRGSAAQWWEVDRTHTDTPTICPDLPSDQDVLLGRPSQGLTALLKPIHKTPQRRRGRRWKKDF